MRAYSNATNGTRGQAILGNTAQMIKHSLVVRELYQPDKCFACIGGTEALGRAFRNHCSPANHCLSLHRCCIYMGPILVDDLLEVDIVEHHRGYRRGVDVALQSDPFVLRVHLKRLNDREHRPHHIARRWVGGKFPTLNRAKIQNVLFEERKARGS